MSKRNILVSWEELPHSSLDEDEIARALQLLLRATLGVVVQAEPMSDSDLEARFSFEDDDADESETK